MLGKLFLGPIFGACPPMATRYSMAIYFTLHFGTQVTIKQYHLSELNFILFQDAFYSEHVYNLNFILNNFVQTLEKLKIENKDEKKFLNRQNVEKLFRKKHVSMLGQKIRWNSVERFRVKEIMREV